MQGDDIKYENFSTCGKLQCHSSIASLRFATSDPLECEHFHIGHFAFDFILTS